MFSKIHLGIILFLFNQIALGQSDAEAIIGKWNVVSVNSEQFHYNVKKDSVFISDMFKSVFSEEELEEVLTGVKATYNDNVYYFRDDSSFEQKIGDTLRMTGTFKLDEELGQMEFSIKNNPEWHFPYKLNGDTLEFNLDIMMPVVTFVLERAD